MPLKSFKVIVSLETRVKAHHTGPQEKALILVRIRKQEEGIGRSLYPSFLGAGETGWDKTF